MDIVDIVFNVLFIYLFCMVAILPYLMHKKAKKILVEKYLKNEQIVNLLENSKYSDFVINCQGVERLNNSNYVRLLNEYLGDNQKYRLRILKIYYSDAAFNAKEEDYKNFKHNIENKK